MPNPHILYPVLFRLAGQAQVVQVAATVAVMLGRRRRLLLEGGPGVGLVVDRVIVIGNVIQKQLLTIIFIPFRSTRNQAHLNTQFHLLLPKAIYNFSTRISQLDE